ncbi:MAG: hypothetical protein E7487_04005 [Ruminococcaceae bacterium]|nr:hypothetical protein [Oscillospiraceae bacterium]
MKTARKLLCILLSLVLSLTLAVPAMAVNENNTLGVTFGVTLNTPTISTSNSDQTVTMTLAASQAITMDGMGFTVTCDSPLTFTSIDGGNEKITFPGADINLNNGIITWSSDDAENLSGVTTMAVITFTVPANTPAGTYNVGITNLELTKDYGDIWENAASCSTTLTITDNTGSDVPPAEGGYTAGITGASTVTVGEQLSVGINAAHESDSVFNAGEIKLSYDASKLTFNQTASALGTAAVKLSTGVIILEDYGADKNLGTGIYTLVFDAIADGETTVALTSAAFIDKTNAVKNDLIPAVLSPDTLTVTVEKPVYNVTLPEGLTGEPTVTDGEDYTFSVSDENYTYDNITATIDGEPAEVIENDDGSYTVENVTGELVIDADRTPKSYSVTFAGNAAEDIENADDTATYGTDYSFTMPTALGQAYTLTSVTIAGEAYTAYTVADSVYTIPGADIKGNIVITVNKEQVTTKVTVEGNGAGAAQGYNPSADVGESYTLTLTPEEGYTYTVTAVMNGETAEVIDNGDNTYTIKVVTGPIVFTVTRTVIVDGVSVSQYVTIDGSIVWLVKNTSTLPDGKLYTYDGNAMFWSDTYNAYCYLVIADTLDTDTVKANIGIANGSAVSVDYGMDVNITGVVDASDAQLVYNIYNALYSAFTSDVTIEKFLRADINGDGIVNVEDAAAIINSLLAPAAV